MSPGKLENAAIQIVPYDQLSPVLQAQVQSFLANHPHNTIFQSPEMFTFYDKVNNFTPHYFIAIQEHAVVAVLLAVIIREYKGPLGFLSSRTVVYGGPVITLTDNRTRVLNELLTMMGEVLHSKSMFIQFRNFFLWTETEKAIFEHHGYHFRDRINLLIPTHTRQQILSSMKENRRRQVLKGLKQGTQLRPPASLQEVHEFYKLLYDLYKDKVRKPLPDWSFFKQFYHYSGMGKLGIIRLVVRDGQVIGGILSPVTNNLNIYEWYVVGLDKVFPQHHSSILATWSAMEYAAHHQLHHFDLMGLGKPDEPYGVRDFKLRFGGEVVNFGRFGRRNYKHLYNFAEIAYNLLRHLKKV